MRRTRQRVTGAHGKRRPGRESGLPQGFGVLWLSVAVDLVGFGIVLPLLPLYAKHFHTSTATIGVLVATFSAAQALCAPLLGRLSDRYGRKPVIVVSMVGTALGSVATGLAPNLLVLFVARAFDGASGSSVAVARAALADVCDPRDRGRIFGLLSTAFGAGFVVGPALGGIAALGSERLPFLLAGVIAGVNAGFAAWKLQETRGSRRRAGAPAEDASAKSTQDVGSRVVLLRALATSFLLVVAFSAFETTLPLFVHRRLGMGLAGTGGIFAAVGVVIVCVQGGLIKPVLRLVTEPVAIRTGLACELAGLVLLSDARSMLTVSCVLFLLAAGQALTTPLLASVVSANGAQGRGGSVLGAQQGLSSLARTVGPLIGGVVFASVSARGACLAAGLIMGLALVVAAGSFGPRALVAEPEPGAEPEPATRVR